jgi:hypothetical protein
MVTAGSSTGANHVFKELTLQRASERIYVPSRYLGQRSQMRFVLKLNPAYVAFVAFLSLLMTVGGLWILITTGDLLGLFVCLVGSAGLALCYYTFKHRDQMVAHTSPSWRNEARRLGHKRCRMTTCMEVATHLAKTKDGLTMAVCDTHFRTLDKKTHAYTESEK